MSTKSRQILTIEESNLADATKIEYGYRLKQFFRNSTIHSLDELLAIPSDELDDALVSYCKFLLSKVANNALSPNTVPKMFKPIKYVLDTNYRENDVRWRPLESRFPPSVRRSGYKAWSTDQVHEMLDKCTTSRNRALVHFMASIGGRVGIHEQPLLMKHMVPMSSTNDDTMDCYAVLLYAESGEDAEEKDYRDSSNDVVAGDSYWAFLTPEATKWLKKYHDERERCCEMINGDSPIFRNNFSVLRPNDDIRQLTKQAVFNIFLRIVNQTSIKRNTNGMRNDTQLMHGFRKRFNTIMKLENTVNANIAEKIMGHKKGLDGVYLAPTRQECFAEFCKAIPQLTIDSGERQKIEINDKSQRIDELEKEREISHNLKKDNEQFRVHMENRIQDELIKTRDELLARLNRSEQERAEIRQQSEQEVSQIHNEVHEKIMDLKQNPEKMRQLKELFSLIEG